MSARSTQPRGDDVNLRSAPQMREYEAIVARIAVAAPARVLDWGCGLGQVSHLLHGVDLDVTSFDYRGDDAPNAEVALERYPDVAQAVWGANRALARVPGLNRVATNVELVATAPR